MTLVFDGRAFAKKKEEELLQEVGKLRKKKVIPKLASILVGENPASELYVNLKSKAAERVGCKVKILKFPSNTQIEELIHEIKKLNKDSSVDGIMVQLPLPNNFSDKDRDRLLETIAKKKDVDGLKKESLYLTPVVRAVLEILKEASSYVSQYDFREFTYKVCVVGYKGFEGGKITKVLKEMGYKVDGADSKTRNLRLKTVSSDIIISATGIPGLIGGDMVKKGAVVIDVGAPKGDVKSQELMDRASFISPVPGGVGPITISCLLENLVEASRVK